jgi:dolichol-phosphate mannosyltransferase/undecaprenyl-phosphate 4-deoxy-4-formamido-L-arabinose transferase
VNEERSGQRELDLPAPGAVEYSVVVPVYNSSESLVELVAQLRDFFEREARASFEIILVDDASPDTATWETMSRLHGEDGRVKAIQLMRNFGQQAATLCGFGHARGRWVVTMDDDLQHIPAELGKLIAARDHDVVMAQFEGRKHGPLKVFYSNVKQWFDHRVLGKPRDLHLSSYRLLKREIVDNILRIDTVHPFIGSMIFMVTQDVKGVAVRHQERVHGTSGYSFARMLRLFLSLLINNSTFLLNVVGVLGLVMAVFSVGVAVVVVAKKMIYDTPIMGWTSLMAMVSFLGGMSLAAISIIGQYLIRIIHEVQGRPAYTTSRIED